MLWQRRGLACGLLAIPTALAGLFVFSRRPVLGIPFLTVIMATIALINLAWWLKADHRLADARRGNRIRMLLALYIVIACLPLLGTALALFEWRQLPAPVAMWTQLWHMWLVLTVPIGAIAAGLLWSLKRISRTLRPRTGNTVFNPDRRAFLEQSLVAAPLIITAGGTLAGLRQRNHFEIHRHRISPPRLPDRLRGLTITHLSDFHVGRLFRREQLHRVVDAANRLNSDLTFITGDVIDNSNDVLPDTIDVLRGLHRGQGLFLCLGNHDLLHDGRAYINTIRQHGLDLLINERRWLDISGERICVGGLMWAHGDSASPRGTAGHREHAATTFGNQPADTFTIAMAHHPHAFDAIGPYRIPLTLSGHTHGGQLMLTPPGYPEVGAGNLLFRYVRGFYTRQTDGERAFPLSCDGVAKSGQPMLFINSGAGNWFPFRFNAPAEIVQLQCV